MTSPVRIVSVGEITLDRYLGLGKEFVGGISLNFAVHAARCGAERVSLISRVGVADAERVRAKLAAEGVDASHVRALPGATAVATIAVSVQGEKVFPVGGYHSGVLEGFLLDDKEVRFAQTHNVLACPLFQQSEPLFRQVVAEMPFEGRRVADFLDLSDYGADLEIIARYAPHLAIAFVGGDAALVERLRPLARALPCLLVVTLGAQGSAALPGGEPLFQPAIPVEQVVDTTGCGDAFQAAFTVSYLRDADIVNALKRGAQQAARVAAHYGATP